MRAVRAALLLFACGCGTDAVGVETCRAIEHLRCRWAEACGVNLGAPVVRRAKSTSPVDDCMRFYDDACLHGLPAPDPNDAGAVAACLDAIDASAAQGNCTFVLQPDQAPACSFLIPPPDSGADTGTADAALE